MKIFLVLVFLHLAYSDYAYYKEPPLELYEKLLNDSIVASASYQMKNNSRHFRYSNRIPIQDKIIYDYIIVGAGSGGCVLANKLSENRKSRVLLIEAGEFGNYITAVTGISYMALTRSEYNWGYYSTPQANCCLGYEENRCPHTRGKGIGGSGLVNGLVFTKGNREDFNIWCGLGNKGWCYEDVKHHFLDIERLRATDPAAPIDYNYHGYTGPLTIEQPMPRTSHAQTFLEANEAMGVPVRDINGESQIGASAFQVNTRRGRRQDSGTAFILPIYRKRKNLTVLIKALVTKILIDNEVATGVLYSKDGRLHSVRARREVILCAGAINTPQLLMLSGIGPRSHLEQLGIPVRRSLSVGLGYSDHILLNALVFTSNRSDDLPSFHDALKSYYYYGTGYLDNAVPREVASFTATSLQPLKSYPDMEISVSNTLRSLPAAFRFNRWRPEINYNMEVREPSDFQLLVGPLLTRSTGWVRLRSADPFDYPDINPNLLSDPENFDLESIYVGYLIAMNLTRQEPFRRINATLRHQPMPQCRQYEFLSREYWYCASRYTVSHNNHPVRTCKMGPNATNGDVVDDELRVHGFRNLRVADASVIPISTASHIEALVYMIALKGAELIEATHWR